jgi:hypothetical protein
MVLIPAKGKPVTMQMTIMLDHPLSIRISPLSPFQNGNMNLCLPGNHTRITSRDTMLMGIIFQVDTLQEILINLIPQ